MSSRVSAHLSVAQQGVWALQKMHPGSTAFNCPVSIDFERELDHDALARVSEIVAELHPALRTRLISVAGFPRQIQAENFIADIRAHDFIGIAEAELAEKVFELVHTPIDLEGQALWRIHLMQLDGGRSRLLFVMHHIIFDGLSAFILVQSFLRTYVAIVSGTDVGTTPEQKSYLQYIEAQSQPQSAVRASANLAYWRRQLTGAADHLSIIADRPRSQARSLIGRSVAQSLPDNLIQQVRTTAQAIGVYQSVVYLSAFFVVLSRHAGQSDLTLGVPFDERSRVYQSTIGFFVNMLPIRARLIDRQSFADLARAVQRTLTEAMLHSHPFADLVRTLGFSGSDDASPIFQHAFMYQNFVGSDAADVLAREQLRPLGAQLNHQHVQTGEYEISLEVFDIESAGRLILKYNPDLFEEFSASGLLDQINHVLGRCVADHQMLTGDISLIDADELLALTRRSGTVVEGENNSDRQTVFDLFRRQAAASQAKTAVRYGDHAITYGQLSARVDSIAQELLDHGVDHGSLVGICLKRSIDLVATILAVLRSRAAYLPLDPNFPAERLAAIVGDCRPTAVVSTAACAAWLQDRSGTSLIDIETLSPQGGPLWADPGYGSGSANDLAYVMYTSGTTGKPKGVMISNGAVLNFVKGMIDQPGVSAEDRLLAVTTYSFDISVLELILPLLCGAECIIASTDAARDPGLLKALIARARPTIMQATPATWVMLFDAGWRNDEKLRILCGGEAIPDTLARSFHEVDCRVWNMYGPTEATIWSAARQMDQEQPSVIGGPIRNTQLYVLDNRLRPVPVGVPGQLFIGGSGLARGYFNQPGLTAEKFLPCPFRSGERMYGTGDLVRWRHDGNLDFLGRIDQQVKIRGFRVELEEIESLLRSHPAVAHGAVAAWRGATGLSLAAYVVSRDSRTLDERDLRAHLRRSLPDFMLPAAILQLESLPLTPNGKVDRKALPKPERRASTTGYVPPRTPGEEALATMWAEILNLERVGIEDNFFDLGGHSIAAVQMIARVRDHFGVEVRMRAVFDAPTIREFSEYTVEHSLPL